MMAASLHLTLSVQQSFDFNEVSEIADFLANLSSLVAVLSFWGGK